MKLERFVNIFIEEPIHYIFGDETTVITKEDKFELVVNTSKNEVFHEYKLIDFTRRMKDISEQYYQNVQQNPRNLMNMYYCEEAKKALKELEKVHNSHHIVFKLFMYVFGYNQAVKNFQKVSENRVAENEQIKNFMLCKRYCGAIFDKLFDKQTADAFHRKLEKVFKETEIDKVLKLINDMYQKGEQLLTKPEDKEKWKEWHQNILRIFDDPSQFDTLQSIIKIIERKKNEDSRLSKQPEMKRPSSETIKEDMGIEAGQVFKSMHAENNFKTVIGKLFDGKTKKLLLDKLEILFKGCSIEKAQKIINEMYRRGKQVLTNAEDKQTWKNWRKDIFEYFRASKPYSESPPEPQQDKPKRRSIGPLKTDDSSKRKYDL